MRRRQAFAAQAAAKEQRNAPPQIQEGSVPVKEKRKRKSRVKHDDTKDACDTGSNHQIPVEGTEVVG